MTDKVLESALKVLTQALNDLCAECIDEQGKPRAPDRRALMKARSMLPAGLSQSLTKGGAC